MRSSFKNIKLRTKIAFLGTGSVLITALSLLVVVFWQSRFYYNLAYQEVEGLINSDLDHITQGVYNLVKTENESVQEQVKYNLNIARYILQKNGGVSYSKETQEWLAINQLNNDSFKVKLPRLLIGNLLVGKQANPNRTVAVVDEVTNLVGGTATIFQRMNARGDMMRVATNVLNDKGERAIGTFIPQRNPDGTINPVIKNIMEGKPFFGRAYIVNAWYITAYEPIVGLKGDIVGVLYVGVKQQDIESRVRQVIVNTKIGRTGYVYVLGGKGVKKGHYIISQNGIRDGENIYNVKDSDDKLVIQSIVSKAIALKSGELGTERYRWQNPGEESPRWKIVRLAYYEPWDWVIGTSTYEDELQSYWSLLKQGKVRMVTTMSVAAFFIIVAMSLIGFLIVRTISQPLNRISNTVREIANGDLTQKVEVGSLDEVGQLAIGFNQMVEKLREIMVGLQESEQKYRSIVDNSFEGIFQTTVNGRFVSANPALAVILGYDSVVDLINSVDSIGDQIYLNSEDRDEISQILIKNGEIRERETQLVCKDKSSKWVLINARLILDEHSAPKFFEGFIIDIDQRKKAEQELRQHRDNLEELISERTAELIVARDRAEGATRAKSIFLANMSHELRTPLNSILGFSEILSQIVESPQQQEYLSSIRSSGKTLLDLINSVLDLSKIEAGKLQVVLGHVDIKTMLGEVYGVFKHQCIDKGIDLTIESNPLLPDYIVFDELKLKQILINLTNNAVKFTKNGYVKISALPLHINTNKVDIRIEISDTGPGIPVELQGKVFEAFEQNFDKGNYSGGGTGLGLAITKQLVNLLNGSITLKSELNKGSIFDLVFKDIPIADEKDVSSQDVFIDPSSVHFQKATLLVVDDNTDNRKVISGLLQSYDFEMFEASNGIEALAVLNNNDVQLVFMDIRMPEMDGFEAVRHIRESLLYRNIPVIAVTASAFHEEEQKVLSSGFDDYLRKPVTQYSLICVLFKHLKYEVIEHFSIVESSKEEIDKGVELESLMNAVEQLYPVWEEIRILRPKEAISHFAEQLIDLGKKHKVIFLYEYGKDLMASTQSFNVSKQIKLIDSFSDLRDRIRKMLNNS
ncbi:MAG: Cache 3/Cache 2 fusion domain-containing protein [Bacteroidales bacterium]